MPTVYGATFVEDTNNRKQRLFCLHIFIMLCKLKSNVFKKPTDQGLCYGVRVLGSCSFGIYIYFSALTDTPVAGIAKWNKRLPQLDGDSTSLYQHVTSNGGHYGDPIADIYALVARPNNAILVVADGCNWGPKPRQAARCAVHGCISDLNSKLFAEDSSPSSTADIFQIMLSSLNGAQRLIVQNEGTTTTLCMAVVCEMSGCHNPSDWGLCVVSVGDSPCFVWQSKTGQVLEVTSASHEGQVRDMRDSGGCLGANVGNEPDLSNLVCCFMHLSDKDIVFLTSDGISDNFDPVTLLQVCDPLHEDMGENGARQLEALSAKRRQKLLLKNLSDLLHKADEESDSGLNAFTLKEAIISHVMILTDEKRQYMKSMDKEIERDDLPASERKKLLKEMQTTAKAYPGKLDHATVAAYQVGHLTVIE